MENGFLWIFAQHVQTIATEVITKEHTMEKPKVLRFAEVGIDHVFEVKLWYRGDGWAKESTIWDQGSIDGEHCGNRSGVVQTFAKKVSEMVRAKV